MVDNKLMALKWQDKRPVVMLTTVHDDAVVTKCKVKAVHSEVDEIQKSLVIEVYNHFIVELTLETISSPTTGSTIGHSSRAEGHSFIFLR